MATRGELINLTNAAHNARNGIEIPKGWNKYDSNDQRDGYYEFGGISLQIYQKEGSKDRVIAIRGTDPGELLTGADGKTNVQGIVLDRVTEEIYDLLKFAKGIYEKSEDDFNPFNVEVTGFSQGGFLAELLSHTFTALWAFKRCGRRVRLWLTNDQNAFYGWNDGVFC